MVLLEETNKDLKNDCDSFKSNIALLEEDLAIAKGERLRLVNEIDVNRELYHVEVENLKENLNLKSANILLLQEQIEAIQKQFNVSQTEVFSLRGENRLLSETNSSIKADLDSCRAERDNLSISFASIKVEYETMSSKVLELNERLLLEEGIKAQLKLKNDRFEEISNITEAQMATLRENNLGVITFHVEKLKF